MNRFATFDLAMTDSEHTLALNERDALIHIQLLLLSEAACHIRIAFLRHLSSEFEPGSPCAVVDGFGDEIIAIQRFGVIDAVIQGRISRSRLCGLISDPDALWHAHIALTEAAPGPIGQGLTALALQGDWDTLQLRLRQFLPALMDHVGIPTNKLEATLAFIVERAHRIEDSRLRDRLPTWLAEFACEEGLMDARRLCISDWETIIDGHIRGVVVAYVRREMDRPRDWLNAYALATEETGSWHDLPELTLPTGFEPVEHFQGFCNEIAEVAHAEYERVVELFELAA